MQEILISEFKAKCIAILKRVQMTREPVVITRRGKPVARVEPIPEEAMTRRLGALRGRMTIHGDIVEDSAGGEWEILHGPAA